MPLPKELFITLENEEDEGGYFQANLTPEDAVSGSNSEIPTVGTYKLVEENDMELIRTTRIRKIKK